MDIRIKKYTLIDEYEAIDTFFAPTIKGTEIQLAKMFVEHIEEQLSFAARILELTAKPKMSREEFAEIINKLYDINLQEKDYNNVFLLAYNKKAISSLRVHLLYTYMVREIWKYNISSYEPKDVERYFKAVLFPDFKHNQNNRYTIEELRKLIEEKKIIILDEFEQETDIPSKLQESYEPFPIYKNYQSMSEDNAFYPYILAYIRGQVSNAKIINDINQYLTSLKERISEVLSFQFNKSMICEIKKQMETNDISTRLEKLIDACLNQSQLTDEQKHTNENVIQTSVSNPLQSVPKKRTRRKKSRQKRT